jgi:hypothetical protein
MPQPDPRLHVGLTEDNQLILDVIEGPWPHGKIVYSISVDAQAMIDAIVNREHLIPCVIREVPLDKSGGCVV